MKTNEHVARFKSTKNYKGEKGETPSGISLTVPEDSYGIKELLRKHQSGMAFNIQRLGSFDLSEDIPGLDAIDMNQFQQLEKGERQQIIQEHLELQEETKKRIATKRLQKNKEIELETQKKSIRNQTVADQNSEIEPKTQKNEKIDGTVQQKTSNPS